MNKISHPASMYFLLTMAVVFLSWIINIYGVGVIRYDTGEEVQVLSLLSPESIRWSLRHVVTNFTAFAPVGMVLVAMLGIGLAQHAGFVDACICRATGGKRRQKSVIWLVIGCGLLSNVVGDAGYVVLLPLAVMLFRSAGLHPVAGIIVAYVSVACGYSVNLLMTTLDPILASTTQEVIDVSGIQSVGVGPLCNYYFFAVSVPVLAGIIYWLTRRWLLPVLPANQTAVRSGHAQHLSGREGRALSVALWVGVFYVIVILLATFSPWGILRGVSGGLLRSPFIEGALFLFSLGMGLMGCIYGVASGRYRADTDIIAGLQQPVRLLAVYLVIAFWASQLFAFLDYSQLDTWLVASISNVVAPLLGRSTGLAAALMFVLYVAVVNLFMVSASAKWSLMAAVFVPVLASAGVPTDATQCAYRIGDSMTNAITPFMFYLPFVLAYMRVYDDSATYVKLLRLSWRFALFIGLGWMALFVLWYGLGLPFGL